MLDPVSALSLAANVVQFVDFGCKIFSESREVYKSAAGCSQQYIELEVLDRSLSRLSDNLGASASFVAASFGPSEKEKAMVELAVSCKEVADETLSAIQNLKLHESNHRKWRSLHAALKTVWNAKKIKNLQLRIDGFSRQLTLQLAAVVWYVK